MYIIAFKDTVWYIIYRWFYRWCAIYIKGKGWIGELDLSQPAGPMLADVWGPHVSWSHHCWCWFSSTDEIHNWLVVWNIWIIFHILAIILAIIIPTDFHIFHRGRYTTNQIRHILTSELVAFVCSFCVCFSECVAKGSCFLSWASRPWWTVCSSFLIFSLMFTPRCL